MLVAAAAAGLVVAALLLRTEVPAGLELEPVDAGAAFGADTVARADAYAPAQRWLWLGGTLAQLAALALLAVAARRARGSEPRSLPRTLLEGLAWLAAVLAALWLARLPWALAAHRRRRDAGLTDLGDGEWLVAPWLELLGTAAFLAVALVAAMALARRLGGRWWLAGGALVAVLGAVAIALSPLLQAPRLEPLADEALAADLTALARGLGVDVGSVEVLRASERTTRANAEVAGLGPTKRVILWDTLLDGRYTRAEIRAVVAHEVAHVERAHLWKGAAWVALAGVPLALLVALATRPAGGLARPAAVPRAALALALAQLVAVPVGGAISRRYEAEADWLALEATRDPDAMRGLLVRLAETNLAQPSPPPAWRLLSTHPPLAERVAMAEAWRVWEGLAKLRAVPSSANPPTRRGRRASPAGS